MRTFFREGPPTYLCVSHGSFTISLSTYVAGGDIRQCQGFVLFAAVAGRPAGVGDTFSSSVIDHGTRKLRGSLSGSDPASVGNVLLPATEFLVTRAICTTIDITLDLFTNGENMTVDPGKVKLCALNICRQARLILVDIVRRKMGVVDVAQEQSDTQENLIKFSWGDQVSVGKPWFSQEPAHQRLDASCVSVDGFWEMSLLVIPGTPWKANNWVQVGSFTSLHRLVSDSIHDGEVDAAHLEPQLRAFLCKVPEFYLLREPIQEDLLQESIALVACR